MRHRTIDHPAASDRNGGEIGFGAVGCGGFGLFALQQLVGVPGLRLVAVTDVSGRAVAAARDRFGADAAADLDALLARDDVDAVYIATPPYLHHDQAMRALAAGKHVICEPPPAVTVEEGEQLLTEARRRDRLMVADFPRRYDPLFAAIAGLLPAGALGQFLHGSFENLGSAEDLPPDHWFWDRALSGGIFVEHGVDFFDLFAGWLGTGRVQAARIGVRSGSSVEEQVDCAVRYDGGGWVSFYHGFRQGTHTDRQTLRLFFELGDVTLLNWTPTRVRMHALVSESHARAVADMFPGARLDLVETYAAPHRDYWGRREEPDADHIPDTAGGAVLMTRRYGELLRAMFTDQAAWIRDHDHPRRVTGADGYEALRTAHEADRLARLGGLGGPGALGGLADGDPLTSAPGGYGRRPGS